MDKEKIKLIVRNLESLIEILKLEVYSDMKPQEYDELRNSPLIDDYDEVFDE
jgi:hypothetical protein